MKNYRKDIIRRLLHQHNKWNKTAATLTIEQIDAGVVMKGNHNEYTEFIQAAKQLQSEGFLMIKERKNDYPKLVITDDIEIIVSYANKEHIYTINEYEHQCRSILNEFKDKGYSQITEFCIKELDNLDNRKKVSICSYNENTNTSDTLREILTGAIGVFRQQEDILTRNFSISIYSDSKKFTKHIDKICKLIAPAEIESGLDYYTILNEYHIYQNPTEAKIKGNFKIEFNNGDTIHGREDSPLSLGKSYVSTLKNVSADNIISIENLTTFNSYKPKENELVIYLGGFVNNITVDFIKKTLTSETIYYHFGDIDAGGFNILLDLENKISHTVIPYKMGIKELKENSEYTKTLTSNDVSKLKSIKGRDNRFDEVIDYMLKNNCKLEQESFDSFVFEY